MLLYPLPALLTPFSKVFIIKVNANNGKNPPSFHFPVIAFFNEEVTGCTNEEAIAAINEAAIDAIIVPKSYLLFFISCFTVSVAPSINRPNFSSDFTTLITSSISSFEIKKWIGTARSNNTFLPKLGNVLLRNSPD